MAEAFFYRPSRHPRDLLRRACRRLGVLVKGVVAVALIALATTLAIVAVPRILGYSALVVRGSSMGDAAPLGSVVIGRSVSPADVGVGDVILIRAEANGQALPPVLHRVVSLEHLDGELVVGTKGDANASADPERYRLDRETISPLFVVPFVGYLVGFAATPAGWVLFSAIPGSVICALWIRSIWAPRPRRASVGERGAARG